MFDFQDRAFDFSNGVFSMSLKQARGCHLLRAAIGRPYMCICHKIDEFDDVSGGTL